MTELEHEDIVAYFTNFDSKKNGTLDFTEFKELISAMGFNIDEQRLKDGFNKVDTDNNNEIDFEEFMSWWGDK